MQAERDVKTTHSADETNDHETNSNNNIIALINVRRGTSLEIRMLADYHSILQAWKRLFCKSLIVRG
jgi:hypothetical protein